MQILTVIIIVFSPFVYNLERAASADVPPIDSFTEQHIHCESVVCNVKNQPNPVPSVGYIPKRQGNEMLNALGSVLYFVGDVRETGELPIDAFIDSMPHARMDSPEISTRTTPMNKH